LTDEVCVWYSGFANQHFKGVIMAIIIKVLDQGTKRPKSGVRVSFISRTGWGKEKWTDKDGCVFYELDPFIATTLTIKDTKKSEQRLGTGENVFYI
jgi:hypothetical protein